MRRAYFRDLPHCQACRVCPTYRRQLFFEIAASETDRVRQIGYNETETPTNDELIEFERSKVFHAPPDLPPED